MRLTDFWGNMRETFGEAYASSVAEDQVLPQLGGRTVNQALRDTDTKHVWIAVCQAYGERVPARIRR
ncbi:DUF3046 family protein [Stackebrandtia endophytica]|uniref:DUF3046 family protein n=1 Tax=Stackebrandtia endophytica TaxID=1496996 RepID=A0A543B2S5_9ACTN|nr:DUF3046 domain-containing protein [Stackebrandtia endophytica]TQL79129.1 DUF3046 family protein [Stackebrandtia endophytica]